MKNFFKHISAVALTFAIISGITVLMVSTVMPHVLAQDGTTITSEVTIEDAPTCKWSGTAFASALTVEAGDTCEINSTDPGFGTGTTSITVENTATLLVGNTAGTDFTSSGLIDIQGTATIGVGETTGAWDSELETSGSADISITNDGSVTVVANSTNTNTLTAADILTIGGGTANAGTLTNYETVTVATTANLNQGATLTNSGTFTANGASTPLEINGTGVTINNSGTFTVTNRTVTLDNGAIVNNTGTGTINFSGYNSTPFPLLTLDGGTINNGSTATINIDPTGTANDEYGDLTLNNDSTIDNAGIITISDDVTVNGTSSIIVDDSGSPSSFTISDTLSLTNTLTLSNSATFTAEALATITIGTGTSTDGRINVYNSSVFANQGTVSAGTLYIGDGATNGGTYTNTGTTGVTTLRYFSTTRANLALNIYQGYLLNNNSTVSPSFITSAAIKLTGTDATDENKGRLTNSGIFEQKTLYMDINNYSVLNLTGGRFVHTYGTNSLGDILLNGNSTSAINISSGAILSWPTINVTVGTLANSGTIRRVNIGGTPQDTYATNITVSNSSTFNNNSGGLVRPYTGTITINNPAYFSNAGNINYENPSTYTLTGNLEVSTTNSITNTGIYYANIVNINSNMTFNNNNILNGYTINIGTAANSAVFNNTGTFTANTALKIGTAQTYGSTFNNNGTATITQAWVYSPGSYTNYVSRTSTITTLHVFTGATFTNNQTLTGTTMNLGSGTINGGTLTNNGSVNYSGGTTTLYTGALYTNSANKTSSLGTLTVNNGATYTNDGTTTGTTFNLTGAFNNNYVHTATGTIMINTGGVYTNGGLATSTMFNMNLYNTGLITNNGTLKGGTLSPPEGVITFGDNSGINVGGTLNNNGTVSYGSIYLRNGGEITNAENKTMDISGLFLYAGYNGSNKSTFTNNGSLSGTGSIYIGNITTATNVQFTNTTTGTVTYTGSFICYGAAASVVLDNYNSFSVGSLSQGYDGSLGGTINNYKTFSTTTAGDNRIHGNAVFNNFADATATFKGNTYLGSTIDYTRTATFNQYAGTGANPTVVKASFGVVEPTPNFLQVYGPGVFNNNDLIQIGSLLNTGVGNDNITMGQFNGNAGSKTIVGGSSSINGLMTIAEGAEISWGTTASVFRNSGSTYPVLTINGYVRDKTVPTDPGGQSITAGANGTLVTGSNSNINLSATPSIIVTNTTPIAVIAGNLKAKSISAGSNNIGGYLCLGNFVGTLRPTRSGTCTNVATSLVDLNAASPAQSIYVRATTNTATADIANNVEMDGGLIINNGGTGTTATATILKDAVVTINGYNSCIGLNCAIDVGAYNDTAGTSYLDVYGTIKLATATSKAIGVGYSSGTGNGVLTIKSGSNGSGYIYDDIDPSSPTQLYVSTRGKLNIDRTGDEASGDFGELYLGGACTINGKAGDADHNRGANIDGTLRCYGSLSVPVTGSVDQGMVYSLAYNSQGGTNFTIGETVTGGTSGATGKIVIDTDAGATGTLTLYSLTKSFQAAETITGSSSGSTATTSGAESYIDRSVVTVDGSTTTITGEYELDGLLDTGEETGDTLSIAATGNVHSGTGMSTNFEILAHDLTVVSGGKIASDGKSTVDPGTQGAGSYGGAGEGRAVTDSYGATKLSMSNAPAYGQGGRTSGGTIDGYGGGGVRIRATGTITHNGEISADGAAAAGANGGGGAGGTVIIIHEPLDTSHTFTGTTGVITANGGSAADSSSKAGAGGKITIQSVFVDDPDFASYPYDGTVQAYPGTNTGPNPDTYASAGTIVYTGDANNPNDTLIVNQNNLTDTTDEEAEIPDNSETWDRIEARNGAIISFDDATPPEATSCFEVGTDSDVKDITCAPNPDKPTPLYINNSITTAQSGTEPSGLSPLSVGDLTPAFSVVYVNPEDTSTIDKLQIQVDDDPAFTSTAWDTTISDIRDKDGNTIEPTERSRDVEYTGDILTPGTTYYVRARFIRAGTPDAPGLWTHLDNADQYKFEITNYMDIAPDCADDAFSIEDFNHSGENIRNAPGRRFGAGTCQMNFTSTPAAWQIQMGLASTEPSQDQAFSDGTNYLAPIPYSDSDPDVCTMDNSGDDDVEAYGFAISALSESPPADSQGTIQTDPEVCGVSTHSFESAASDVYHDLEATPEKIIQDDDEGESNAHFDFDLYVNLGASTVPGIYTLDLTSIITTAP